ncbi:MAG TPA: HAD family hydrolase, partial [Solirubrobacteraceae bacterium]|nr:HAD family hydrolase [Solirubrobacteraceae bacterium]
MEPRSEQAAADAVATLSPDADARLAEAFRLVRSGEVSVLSLDVFDTVLWRRVAEPVDAFLLLAGRLRERGLLADGVTDAEFGALRQAAEKRAREDALAGGGGREVTLDAIHGRLPRALLTRDVPAGELAELECELERDLLVPDLDVAELIGVARAEGRTVVAVSDTYFSERQLRVMLARGPLAGARFDRVFASSAHGTGKGEGLFSVVLETLGCRPEEVVHVGDNHDADVVPARRLGMRTVYFERRPPALDRIMQREAPYAHVPPHHAHGENGLAALRGKVLGRAERARQPEGLRAFWEYGAASLGPAFTAFAEWVHARAEREEVSKAFCLMREGELLSRLVNAAAPACDSAVTAEPLWLSRQVCARANIVEGTREELEALFERRRLPTLREFAGTVGAPLEAFGELGRDADRWLDDAGFGDEVIDAIVYGPDLRMAVVAHAQELRRRILRYLESVRPPGEETLLLVDLGWGATIQSMAQRLLREAQVPCRTVGLYLVTGEKAAQRALDGVESHGFLASFGLPEDEVLAVMRSPEVLEQLCMPDHGSQVSITEELQPVLAEAPEEFAFQGVQRAAVQSGILAFQREWSRYRRALPATLEPLWRCPRERLLATLVRAVVAPTPDEAALFGAWLHDENFGSDRVDAIATGPTVKALPHLDPRTLIDIPMTQLYWPFGLAALHDEHLSRAAAAVATGQLSWEAFGPDLETGRFEVYPDVGWGFAEETKLSIKVRRNRRGLSFARAMIRGDFVKRVRLDPAKQPSVIRLDWVRLRCRVHGRKEPVEVLLESPQDFAGVRFHGAHQVAPKLLVAPGDDPYFILDVERRAGGPVYEADLECAFAVLGVPRSQARERRARLRAALRRTAKDSRWLGAPLR